MTPETITTLATTHAALSQSYPHLQTELDRGLLLALAGSVTPVTVLGRTEKWFVNGGGRVYNVEVKTGKWVCQCWGSQYVPEEKSITVHGYTGCCCKHIAAVAIVAPALELVEEPASVWELVTRLIEAQVAPDTGKLLDLPGTKAKLKRMDRDGRDVIVIQTGHYRSKPLVRWGTDHSRQQNAGIWKLTDDAAKHYQEWVEEIQNG